MNLENPYQHPAALFFSNYSSINPITDKKGDFSQNKGRADCKQRISSLLRKFILDDKHPCVMARAAMRSSSCRFGVYPSLGSAESTAGLSHDLIRFMLERPSLKNPYASFMAVFEKPRNQTELAFEQSLWLQLYQLQQVSQTYYAWDKNTSHDPESDSFGFSFGGKAFYVVGMHPNSSRKARQFHYPMLVFNLHEQFEALRASGSYEKVKAIVRKNDVALQGTVNPMLSDFGQASEAKQYSGRRVDNSWKCPYLSALKN